MHRRAKVSGSAIRVVSTPSRQGQWALHPRRQYPIAPGSVGVPSASSVPQCARVRGRTSESEPPVGPPPGQRAQLAPQLEPTAGRVTYCTNAQTNELGQDDSSEQARWPREPAHGPHARASLGQRAGGVLPRPATRTNCLHRTKPARSEPDPGPCLRPGLLLHQLMIRNEAYRLTVGVTEHRCLHLRFHRCPGCGCVGTYAKQMAFMGPAP